ncbi:MAG: 2-alkenal reductase [Thiobacillus sp. SCN 63-374]|uniref:Do family serine endopeptidase n=1 Tax=Thiobacillus sp. TaxID=924 RepID=UPI000869853F|nr:Do family serine endopeptidase [Thiobacillus sp.]MBN8778036.1 Do family serine endopeptidase [Thiobacillus sp.]MBS0330966.1 Do family serine endopeptidase [Pseudomonadota bacterium]ODU40464.1 MAG: 2-alkenal reductase [Thiobacillus sp. SCN 63-374]
MHIRKLWLLFAQTTTVALGVLFIIALFKPDLLRWQTPAPSLTIQQAAQSASRTLTPVESFAPAAQKVIPSVVNVFTQQKVSSPAHPALQDPIFRYFFGDRLDARPREVSNLGSGVIISPNGYILTNQHVVEAADEIQVALANGKTVPARVVGSDPETDLAVLKIDANNLPAITFAESDSLKVGDWVLAVGNPFGVGQTVTAGIVSALGRTHLGINTFENFIQTDAAINPGNSGGALVDASGNLVGINSAIYSRTGGSQGIGFAIPVSIARKVMEQIIKSGSVTRGWVGVEVQDLSPELAESFSLKSAEGALIAGVLKGGPADVGGIRPGDILLAVNGRVVADSASLLNLIAALKPGEDAQLTVARKQQTLNLKIQVGRRPMQRTVESTQAPEPEIN